jgi:sirohydrochlorin ferrochelatase
MAPQLIAVAHGSRSSAAQESVRALLDVVRSLRPGLRACEAYVELAAPALPDVLRSTAGEDVVVVPLLLGNGYHIAHDVGGVTAAYRPEVAVAAALGPDLLLADALADRLAEAEGLSGAGPVVLAAAGSSDPRAHRDTEAAARLLAVRLGRAVLPAYASGSGPRVADTVATLRAAGFGPVSVATYLLAPGRFAAEVRSCGADAVAEPLGAHPALARLVLDRYEAALDRAQVHRVRLRRS